MSNCVDIDLDKSLIVQIYDLQQENQELKEQLLVTKTNEETFRLEMKDITQTLGLDEDTIFDDVKAFVRSLEIENQKYKEVIDKIKHYIEKECRIYGLSMPIDVATHLDNILGILKEVE